MSVLQLREQARQAAQSNSQLDPIQLYRDRLEFAEKIHGTKKPQTYIAMWNLAAVLFENDLKNAEALALVEKCRSVWAENPKLASPDKAKMAGKQLVHMWEAIGGDENIEKASEMRELCGMKQIIVKVRCFASTISCSTVTDSFALAWQTDKKPEQAKGDLMGGLAAALASRAKIQ